MLLAGVTLTDASPSWFHLVSFICCCPQMPHMRTRNPSPIPEATWDSGLKEMNETWKGAIACLGVAVFFVMTIGIIYWQVVDQPNKNWMLKGALSGVLWERRGGALLLHSAAEEHGFVEIRAVSVASGSADGEVDSPFVRNLCWFNSTEFCYAWDGLAELRIALDADESGGTECYRVNWTPLQCHVELKDCFSMSNVSWYGGASLHSQHWPMNSANASLQPFTISDLQENPFGYGSVLERYFLGSSGVALLLAPDVPLQLSIESRQQFCVGTSPGAARMPLQYTVCVGRNLKAVHQHAGRHFYTHKRALPNLDVLRLPFWKLQANVDSGAKLERELRTFSNRLKRHRLWDGVIALDEHSTLLLSGAQDHEPVYGRRRHARRELPLIKLLNISLTLSTFLPVDTRHFHKSLQEGGESRWLSIPATTPHTPPVPMLTHWRGKVCVKLNISSALAVSWLLERVDGLRARLGMEYLVLEGGEGGPRQELTPHAPRDEYVELLAGVAARMGDTTIMSSGSRSSHMPLFIRMHPLHDDWSSAGLRGIIPSVLHYSLLGYDFFIPDAVGGSLSSQFVSDQELFIRWLEIVSFLPAMAFQTPPWVWGENKVVNLTRMYITKHKSLVVPLILKYAKQWVLDRTPIYRPLWWISPDDPATFTVDDEFLIGDEMLVAPVTERGALRRDVYLPGAGVKWQDISNGQVFDGGTLLQGFPVGLEEVAVFARLYS